MSKWTRNLNQQLRMTGAQWQTELNDECVSFYGIFDAENRLETDDSGMQVLIAGSSLTALSTIAELFSFNQKLTDEQGAVWFVREVMKLDDGALSRCNITEMTNDS